MEYTLQIRGSKIIEDCLTSTSKDPIEIFKIIIQEIERNILELKNKIIADI